MNERISIRRATTADASLLAELGARTFSDTFAADNRPEDMSEFLSASFAPEVQRAEIEHAANVVLLAEEAGSAVGYASLRSGPAHPGVTPGPALEIARIYVDRTWIGRGVAQRLMEASIAVAREQGAAVVWLGVWERNPRAIAFYRKYGFVDVGEQQFRLGSDVQNDRVMALSLSSGGR